MNNLTQRAITTGMLGIVLTVGWYSVVLANWLLLFSFAYITLVEWPVLAKKNPWWWTFCPVYLGIPFLLMIMLNNSTQRILLFLLFVLVGVFDSGAYVVGTCIGYHKLCPALSPGKTWQGLAGGLVCALAVTYIITLQLHITYSLQMGIATAYLCILALTGDLFESWLKRKAGIKDSGTLLPGHGGLLDRFDSYLVAIYGVYTLIWLWNCNRVMYI